MKRKLRHRGSTLTEMVVVIAAIVLLVGLAVPAVRALLHSFESSGGAKSMIGAALASARAIAAKERRYAGVRFQKAYDPEGPLKADQYMILIVHEEPRKMGNVTIGFRAVEGLEPMKLPDTVGVMDAELVKARLPLGPAWDPGNTVELTDLTAFSIVFSPSGRMVIHNVRVRNRDGRTSGTETATLSSDDVFNTPGKVTNPVNPIGIFIQDDYPALGLGPERSRRNFVIYERPKFRQASGKAAYLQSLIPETIYINPYTGTMIEK